MTTPCIDALLWIGNSSHQYRTIDQFVTEAKLRGCCRQLDCVHGWMRFGQSKIFLAHRGSHKDPARGAVFGYFVLERIELIVTEKVAEQMVKLSVRDPWPKDARSYIALAEEHTRRGVPRKRIKSILREKLQQEHIPRIAAGQFSRQSSLEPRVEDFIEVFQDAVKELLKEWWDERRSRFVPHDVVCGEGHRGCSIRKGPGAVYAVDALCAATHDKYRELLNREIAKKNPEEQKIFVRELKRRQMKLWYPWIAENRPRGWSLTALMKAYDGPFLRAVKECHVRRNPKHLIDERLRGRVTQCGGLVVFDRPFPVYESSPRASFRGTRRVDGNELIQQIASRKGATRLTLKVNYCDGEEDMKGMLTEGKPRKILTKEQLAACLGQDLRESKASCIRLLDRLGQMAQEQLRYFGKFKLPGVGTILVRGKRDRKRIKFTAAKAISRNV